MGDISEKISKHENSQLFVVRGVLHLNFCIEFAPSNQLLFVRGLSQKVSGMSPMASVPLVSNTSCSLNHQ